MFDKIDFSDVKPSIISWVIVGLMAITFIVFAKYVVTRFPVKGLTEVVQSV